MAGAPLGNDNAAKKRDFEKMVRKCLVAEDHRSLYQAAMKVLALASDGERWAVEMLRDTLDGKPAQQIIATDTEGRSLAIGLVAYAAELRPDDTLQVHSKALPAPDIEGSGQRH